jgi:hypothetical protein
MQLLALLFIIKLELQTQLKFFIQHSKDQDQFTQNLHYKLQEFEQNFFEKANHYILHQKCMQFY